MAEDVQFFELDRREAEAAKSKLSVCVPTYNQGQFIGELLESLRTQTVSPFEVVVSDNCSTDETARVLDRHLSRIRMVSPAQHVPMAENFAYAAAQAHGEWLCFFGSDDLARPDFVERIENGIRIARDTDVLLFGGSEIIGADGRIVERSAILSLPKRVSGEKAFTKLLSGPILHLDSVAIRRAAFEAVGGFDPKGELIFDWILFLQLSSVGSFLNLKRYLSRKRFWMEDGRRRGQRAAAELRGIAYAYEHYIAPRFIGADPRLGVRARDALRRKWIYLVYIALSEGHPIKEFADLWLDYRRLLGSEESLEAFLARNGILPLGDKPQVERAIGRPLAMRLLRSCAAFALGWR